jgi:5-formyltetrahydrofolate cyclo-ligase
MEEKKKMRKKVKQLLTQLTDKEKQEYSEAIAEKLYALSAWKKAKCIGITISRGNEVHTLPIIEKAWCEGKKICVPKCDPDEKTMVFREIHSFAQLESVYFGLLEPIEDITKEVEAAEMDLMVVPGIVFSRDGYRIGYGGGYYDRYLQQFTQTTISLAYSVQIVERVPAEPHDIPVQMIITNNEVIVCDE